MRLADRTLPIVPVCHWCGKASGCSCATDLPTAFDWQRRSAVDELIEEVVRTDEEHRAALQAHGPYPDDATPGTTGRTP